MVTSFLCCMLGIIAGVSAVYQETACANAGGNCMSTSQTCDGNFLTGYCPQQPANIKCCKSGSAGTGVHQETACYNAGGNCMSTSSSCNGHFVTGKCPTQPVDIKCCVKDSSDGNGVHQETACANAGGNCMSTSGSCDGNFLTGYCPTQSANIKCCKKKGGSDNSDSDSETAALNWIIQKESGGVTTAKNPHSTAFGLGQLLNYNRATYARRLGISNPDTTNYDEQLRMMKEYIKERYGTAIKAKQFWVAHNWY